MRRFERSLIKVALVSCVVFGSLSSVATAQSSDVQTLVDRLNRLEADLTNVQRKVFQGASVPAPNVSASGGGNISGSSEAAVVLSSRLDALEEEQRRITGSYEEINFRIEQIKTRLDKLVLDIDYRLTEIETRLNGGGGQPVVGSAQQNPAVSNQFSAPDAGTANDTALAAPQTTQTDPTLPKGSKVLGTLKVDQQGNPIVNSGTTAPATSAANDTSSVAAVTSSLSPADQYNEAISMIRKDDYAGAEVAFRTFLEANSEHPLAGNAQYWLGESYYVRGDYPNAASAFLGGYQNYPKSGKAADNLLKLAMTLGRMEQKVEACATFEQLDKQFSNLPARLKRIAGREKTKFECN
ncbi:tol-pal system protein YbgF [Sneathiella sp. P13V-1]|uniref:tol-pal system protein YbgF n=1 Tax=Sneathiella sp. P13V-1 TaxID=2697366 RepID=UPI00187B9AFF|nr:tol-pal system protein YbgF [Sneathiella sp. P13V-1]MBE7637966.1 tol-pal system protein YbgF [Sneathiella sp. P13V-1]